MRIRTIITLGKPGAGKTQLLRCLSKESFEEEYARLPYDHHGLLSFIHQSTKFHFWDISGSGVYLNQFFTQEPTIFFYCIDVSREIDEPFLDVLYERIKKCNPDNSLIIIGTHADLCENKIEAKARLGQLPIKPKHQFLTSAKDGTEINDVFSTIIQLSNQWRIKELKLELIPPLLHLSKTPSHVLYKEIQSFIRNCKRFSPKEQAAGLAMYLQKYKTLHQPQASPTKQAIFWIGFAFTALLILLAGVYMLGIASSARDIAFIHYTLQAPLIFPMILVGLLTLTASVAISYGFFSNTDASQNATHSKQTPLSSLENNEATQDEGDNIFVQPVPQP